MLWLWIWLVLAVAAAIGETLTYDLFLASVAGAAIVTAFAGLILPWPIQLALFAVLSLLGIFVLRPAAKAALGLSRPSYGSIEPSHGRVVGRKAVVTSRVTADTGQIRIGNGEFWTARSFDPQTAMEPEAEVRVALIEGVTALVEPVVESDEIATTVVADAVGERGN
jgi:membrane protein implicated in regulation of membrane protease activity